MGNFGNMSNNDTAPVRATRSQRAAEKRKKKKGRAGRVLLVLLIVAIAAAGGLTGYKVYKGSGQRTVDIGALIRAQVTPASKKAISVSADDLLEKAGVPESDSRYIEKQQAAQVFVDSLQYTTEPAATDLTDYIGKEIEVTAKADSDHADAVQKALGVKISGLGVGQKITVEDGSTSASGDSSENSSGSSKASDKKTPEKSSKKSSDKTSGKSSGKSSEKSSSDKGSAGKKFTASSIRSESGLLKAGQNAGKSAVTGATKSARTGKSVNKEAFAGTSNRFTDPSIRFRAAYLGTSADGKDILVCIYAVEMYDNGADKEDWVNTFEGAHFSGITTDTTEARIKKGMTYDTYFYKQEGEDKLIQWYEKKFGVTMEKIK